MNIKITLFEDNSNLRHALSAMLNAVPEFTVISAHPNCVDADLHILSTQPDVVLMDIDMPEVNGIQGVKMIKESSPTTPIIMLTVFEDDEKIFQAIQAGADGYLLKSSIGNQLIEAIKDTMSGGASISPGIAMKVLNAFRKKTEKQNFGLSKRETEVLEQLVAGQSYKLIAANSYVSIDTVRSHIKNIYTKLQVNSATEAVAKALKYRIVEID